MVKYSDPHIPSIPPTRKYDLSLNSIPLTSDIIQSADLLLLATDHDGFDYDLIAQHALLIIDARGRFKAADNIVQA